MHLIEEHSIVDPTYIEDFLLTYRTFLTSPLEVGNKLLEWFTVDSLRDKVGLSRRDQYFWWQRLQIVLSATQKGIKDYAPAIFYELL